MTKRLGPNLENNVNVKENLSRNVNFTISQGGVLPNIQAVLLPKKSAGGKTKSDSQEI